MWNTISRRISKTGSTRSRTASSIGKSCLREFWRDFIAAVNEIKDLRVTQVLDALNELLGPHIFPAKADGGDPRLCPLCNQGQLSLKVGKFGAFIGCSNYPECRFTRQLKTGDGENGEAAAAPADTVLGNDPETGLPVCLKSGRFGPYIQLGEGGDGEKPKRASIPSGMEAASIDLDYALRLLALPRRGRAASRDRKGDHGGLWPLRPLCRARRQICEDRRRRGFHRRASTGRRRYRRRRARGKGRAARDSAPIKVLGEHPELGGKVEVLSGRYGPYIKIGKVNATIPKGKEPDVGHDG